ncbi:MAG: hypothetical protein R6U92_01475 [Bacillota bacterium]
MKCGIDRRGCASAGPGRPFASVSYEELRTAPGNMRREMTSGHDGWERMLTHAGRGCPDVHLPRTSLKSPGAALGEGSLGYETNILL